MRGIGAGVGGHGGGGRMGGIVGAGGLVGRGRVLIVLIEGCGWLQRDGGVGGGRVGGRAHHHHVHRGTVDDVVVDGVGEGGDGDTGGHAVVHGGVDSGVAGGRGHCRSVHSDQRQRGILPSNP